MAPTSASHILEDLISISNLQPLSQVASYIREAAGKSAKDQILHLQPLIEENPQPPLDDLASSLPRNGRILLAHYVWELKCYVAGRLLPK